MGEPSELPLPHRSVIGWCLYDFAATVLMANGGLYFAAWLVTELGTSDVWFNATLAASTLLVLSLGPVWGRVADQTRWHRPMILAGSVLMVVGTVALHVISRSELPSIMASLAGLACLLLVITAFQFATITYNGLFVRAFSRELHRRISGLGVAASWLGAIIGVLLILPFVEGSVPGIEGGRTAAFLPSAAIFAVLGSIALSLMPSASAQVYVAEATPLKLASAIEHAAKSPALFWFLTAYVLLMDAILTIQNNLPIFLERVVSASVSAQASLFLTLFASAAVGGALSILILKVVPPGRTLSIAALAWAGLITAIAFTPAVAPLFLWFALSGVLLGLTGSAWRVAFAGLVPTASATTFFGIYNAFERLASVLGPLAWGGLLILMSDYPEPMRYRGALLAMAVFSIASFIALARHTSLIQRSGSQHV